MNANHVSSGKSATIHQLPTASAFPVVQPARRGKLPSHIKSIPKMLLQRDQETKALLAKHKADMTHWCFTFLERVKRGEIEGLAIIQSSAHGPDLMATSGVLADDLGYLANSLGRFADLVGDRIASRENEGPEVGQ